MPFIAAATLASSALIGAAGWVWLATPDGRWVTTTLLLGAFAACAALCVVEHRLLSTTIDEMPVYYVPDNGLQIPFIDSYTPARATASFIVGLVLDVMIVTGLAVRHDGPTPIELVAFVAYVSVSGAYAWRTVRLVTARASEDTPRAQ